MSDIIQTPPDGDVLWVRTVPTPVGYDVIIDAGKNRRCRLDPRKARRYAAGILAAVARADHDAAVAHQLQTTLSADQDDDKALRQTAMVLDGVRSDRPALPPAATWPVTLTPGVNRDLEPFLLVTLAGDDKPSGQWTLPDAREHALAVLESTAVADLDAAYRRSLRGVVGVSDETALAMINDLSKHRWDAR